MTYDYQMPFKNPNEGFNSALLKDYIVPLSKWFIDASSENVFLRNTNSSWEAALAMQYLIEVDSIMPADKQPEYSHMCIEQTRATLMWLIQRATAVKDDGVFIMQNNLEKDTSGHYILYCWDNNTWDTSVIISAIILAVNKYGESIWPQSEKNKVKDVIRGGILWIIDEFDEKRKEYLKYCFGATDFAPILSMLVLLLESKYTKSLFSGFKSNEIESMAKELTNYLLIEKEEQEEYDNDRKAQVTANHWSDSFITAEVSNALVSYFKYSQKKKRKSDSDIEEIGRIYTALKYTGHWFEVSQTSDGMWGSHDDTIHSLQAYIRLEDVVEKYEKKEKITVAFEREEHKVFKAIRWLLDEKQCVYDGSYLHTSFLTVFFGEMLLDVYSLWSFSWGKNNKTIFDKPVYMIYDEVFWMSPVRSAPERTKNIQYEIDKEVLNNKLKKAKDFSKVLAIVGAFAVGLIFAVSISLLVGAIKVTNIDINDDRLFGIVDVVTLILTVVLTYFVIQKIGGDGDK